MHPFKMLCVRFLLCMAVLPFARCHFKIHEHMTPEEVMAVFHTTHDAVPDYELVKLVHDVHKRSPNSMQQLLFSAFGLPFDLALQPNNLWSGNSLRMIAVSNNKDGSLHYEEIAETGDYPADTYHDLDNMAAISIIHLGDGKVEIKGTIGDEYAITPVPNHVQQRVGEKLIFNDTNFLPDDLRSKRSYLLTGHHIVFKQDKAKLLDRFSDYAFMEPDEIYKATRSRRSTSSKRPERDAPYAIYPEILCIVDYDGYRMHGGDNLQIKHYFVSFWNGVDLRYKLLKGPKIRISIAGIIISRGRDATPYLERNRVGRDAIDSAAALTDMGKYLFRERRLPVYDIAVAVTKLDMCRRQHANDVCNRGTAGFAYVGGACVVNKRLEKVNSVAIIEDTGGFSGIIVAAHEVGHLLGAVHDGSPPPSYLGGPGAEKCRWEDGYIMSDLRHTEKGFKWSHCSVSSFHHFLNGDTATCLYNAPHEDEALPRVLPGKLLSLDAQCRKDRGTSACFKDDRVCAQLFCFDAASGYCVAYRPAAEGSPCGDGQYCINGKCVAEHENIIPDYTQNIPTYVRRESTYGAPTQSRPLYPRFNSNTTEYRYPMEETTQIPNQAKYKYNMPYSKQISKTVANSSFPTITPFTTQYTQTKVNNLITDNEYNQKYVKPVNKIFGNAITTPTVKKYNRFLSHLYNLKENKNTNDVNYQRANPFRYNNSASLTSNTTPTNKGSQYPSNEVGECQDDLLDCGKLIDRMTPWACQLQSVKSRCCASLKAVCKV